MKYPKKVNTLCPTCRKHSEHVVKLARKIPILFGIIGVLIISGCTCGVGHTLKEDLK